MKPVMEQSDYECTLEDLGAEMGLNHRTEWDYQTRGLKKLRAELDRRGITFDDLIGD